VGKSAVINRLVNQFGAHRISTRELIQLRRPEIPTERAALQAAGEELDRESDGSWVAESLPDRARALGDQAIIVIDSVRIARQIEHLRKRYLEQVLHLHLTASFDVLKSRFLARKAPGDPATYDEAIENATERQVDTLKDVADAIVNTDELTAEQAAELAAEEIQAKISAV
jgi:adenylosuccinate synthase